MKLIHLFLVFVGILISIGISILTQNLINIAWVFIIIPLIYLIVYFYGKYNASLIEIEQRKLDAKLDAKLMDQSMIISCVKCSSKHTVPIFMAIKNTFTCTKCNTKNSIILDCKVVKESDINEITSETLEKRLIDAAKNANEL